MVLVGNAETFGQTQRTNMWRGVIGELDKASEVSDALPLCCKKHPQEALLVHTAEDFSSLAADGGCSRPCGFTRPCKHVCPRRCVSAAGVPACLHMQQHHMVKCAEQTTARAGQSAEAACASSHEHLRYDMRIVPQTFP